MEVMLLAAGLGSRLQEITEFTPKCLIEVSGKPILEWNLIKLKQAGASKIVINLHHLSDQVVDFLAKNSQFGLPIVFSHEQEELLNTGGGLKNAEAHFSGSESILVLNADILCSASFDAVFEKHVKSGVVATLLTRAPEEPRVLLFDQTSHKLMGWRNNKTRQEQFATTVGTPVERGFCGIQVVSPVIFQYLGRPVEKRSTISAYLDAAQDGKEVVEYPTDNDFWFDIGTPEQLEACRKYFEGKEVVSVKS